MPDDTVVLKSEKDRQRKDFRQTRESKKIKITSTQKCVLFIILLRVSMTEEKKKKSVEILRYNNIYDYIRVSAFLSQGFLCQ